MFKSLLRLAFAATALVLVLISTPRPAVADTEPCAEMLFAPPGFVCHRVQGVSCSHCQYYCSDGEYYWWNTCPT